VSIGIEHVDVSLCMEHSRDQTTPVMALLKAAASGLVAALQRGPGEANTESPADIAGAAFRGLTLLEALLQTGSKADAFTLLHLERTFRGGNHDRAVRTAEQRVADLEAVLERRTQTA
jgi:hypothetical protein